MFQSDGQTGQVHDLQLKPSFLRASWSHPLRKPGEKVKIHALFHGVPDGTSMRIELQAASLAGEVLPKNPPTTATVSSGRCHWEWTAELGGPGAAAAQIAIVSFAIFCDDIPMLVGFPSNALVVAEFGALLSSIDRQFCPGAESLEIKATILDPSNYVRAGILRIYGNCVEKKSYPDAKALVYQRLLTPRELTTGTHTLRWEGFCNVDSGPFAPPEKGAVAYVHPMYGPYVVQVQLLDRVCEDVKKWPDDALPSMPTPAGFAGTALEEGPNGFQSQSDPTKIALHAGFDIRIGGLELSLGDYVEDFDDGIKGNKYYQYRLNQLGYFCGPVDGKIGPISQKGIGHFKRTHWEMKNDPAPASVTGKQKDYDKPLGGWDLAKVTGDLDGKTKEAILYEDDERTFLEIIDDSHVPTGDVNRLPSNNEKARILLDGEIPYQVDDEFIKPTVIKQEREAEWIPRPWLPVIARLRLVKRDGKPATGRQSMHGTGPCRVLFRLLDPKEDHSNLGFPTTFNTGLAYTAHNVAADGTKLQDVARAYKAQGFYRREVKKTLLGRKTVEIFELDAIWDDPANSALRTARGKKAKKVKLKAGDVVQIPPFPEYLDYAKHVCRYQEKGNVVESRPKQYVWDTIEGLKGTSIPDSEYDNCLAVKKQWGERDKKEKARGIECFQYDGKLWPLTPYEPTEDKDRKLGKGKVAAVGCPTKGVRRGTAGLFFIPSRIAGDAWHIEVEVDIGHGLDGKDHENAKALAKRYPDGVPGVRTGRITVWKRVRIAEFLYLSPRPAAGPRFMDWTKLVAHYKKGFVDVVLPGGAAPAGFTGRQITAAEYGQTWAEVDSSISVADATAAFDPGELWPRIAALPYPAQNAGEDEWDYIDRVQNYGVYYAGLFGEAAAKVLRKKNRTGWLILDIPRYFKAIPTNDDAGVPVAVGDVNNIIANNYTSFAGTKGFLLMDQRDTDKPWYTFSHEMGHGLFLYHHRYAGDKHPKDHDPADLFCLMSYPGPGQATFIDPVFCGKCLLALRGWNVQIL